MANQSLCWYLKDRRQLAKRARAGGKGRRREATGLCLFGIQTAPAATMTTVQKIKVKNIPSAYCSPH